MKYELLLEMEFEGICKEVFEVPQTRNGRDALLVEETDPFAATLLAISKAVKTPTEGRCGNR